MPQGCVNYKRDDPIAFSIIWQINRLLDKLSAHIDGSSQQDFENCREHLYVLSISIEERLMLPVEYDPVYSILKFYRDPSRPHDYRRFH